MTSIPPVQGGLAWAPDAVMTHSLSGKRYPGWGIIKSDVGVVAWALEAAADLFPRLRHVADGRLLRAGLLGVNLGPWL
jgi:hypothetical protein